MLNSTAKMCYSVKKKQKKMHLGAPIVKEMYFMEMLVEDYIVYFCRSFTKIFVHQQTQEGK